MVFFNISISIFISVTIYFGKAYTKLLTVLSCRKGMELEGWKLGNNMKKKLSFSFSILLYCVRVLSIYSCIFLLLKNTYIYIIKFVSSGILSHYLEIKCQEDKKSAMTD